METDGQYKSYLGSYILLICSLFQSSMTRLKRQRFQQARTTSVMVDNTGSSGSCVEILSFPGAGAQVCHSSLYHYHVSCVILGAGAIMLFLESDARKLP